MSNTELVNFIKTHRDSGLSWTKITKKANAAGFRTVTGLPWCDSNLSKVLIKLHPEYKTHTRKRKSSFRNYTSVGQNTNANEVAINLILTSSALSIKDRLEIAMKLL